jgi:predicted ArsR family transcriptional regulator
MRHRFKTQYTEDNFLNALSKTDLRTAGYIAGVVGCTLPTAKTYLKSLTEQNLIESVSIDDGQIVAYKLKDQ